MQGHLIKERVRHIVNYTNHLPLSLSSFTQVRRPDILRSTYCTKHKSLWSNVVYSERPFMSSYNWSRWRQHDPVAWLSTHTKGKKGITVDGARNTSNKKAVEDNSPMIILIDDKGNVSSLSLYQAMRMGKRKDLKVVKVEDSSLSTKDKQVYKLLTGRQYYEEEMKSKKNSRSSGSKAEKMLPLSAKITPHDLKSKLKNVLKWMSKGHPVRVTLMSGGASKEEMDSVFATIEKEIKSIKGCILQKQEKMGRLKFLINPAKETIVNGDESKTQDDHIQHTPLEGTHDGTQKANHER